jgi:16S rRNA C967 or C1407 C5-methylase (RsmB/RsmF family)
MDVAASAAPFVWTDAIAAEFPSAFVAFLRANNIHPDNYKVADLPRYVRVSPRAPPELTRSELERQLGAPIEPVDWLPGSYFRVPSHVKIAGSRAYKDGHLYGIDVSSGAAVLALDVQPGDDVLDLCCAPGAKLCALADAMELFGTLTGVDVSEERLAACRTLCAKYGATNVRLLLRDGQTFSEPPPRRRDGRSGLAVSADEAAEAAGDGIGAVGSGGGGSGDGGGGGGGSGGEDGEDGEDSGDGRDGDSGGNGERSAAEVVAAPASSHPHPHRQPPRKRRRRDAASSSFFMGSALTDDHDRGAGVHGYDRVLVDAECTHDGSIKHLAKFAQWGWETFERRFLDTERLTSLTTLQAALLAAGFRALKPGGTLVYSTCSFARAQNEAIVEAFVRAEPRAELVPIESLRSAPCRAGDVPHTLRFEPRISQTSGLFVAKLTKLAGVG